MPLSERLRRFGKLGVVAGFGLLVFVVVLYLTLPYDRFKDYLAAQVSNYGYELEASEAGPSLGLGMTMRDISLVSRPSGSGKPMRILVERAQLSVSLLSYLMGGKAYHAAVDVFGGEVNLNVRIGKSDSSIRSSAADIDLAELPWVKNLINLPAFGKLDAKLALAIPKQQLSEGEGSLGWDCTACALGDGKAKLIVASSPLLAEGLGLPRIRLGDFHGKVAINKGVGRLQNVQFKSQDVEATVEGEIHLAQPLATSRVDLYLRFKLSDSLLRSSEKLRTLMDLTTQMGKRPDGFIGLRMTGTFRNMGSVQWLKTSPFQSAATPDKPPYRGPAPPSRPPAVPLPPPHATPPLPPPSLPPRDIGPPAFPPALPPPSSPPPAAPPTSPSPGVPTVVALPVPLGGAPGASPSAPAGGAPGTSSGVPTGGASGGAPGARAPTGGAPGAGTSPRAPVSGTPAGAPGALAPTAGHPSPPGSTTAVSTATSVGSEPK